MLPCCTVSLFVSHVDTEILTEFHNLFCVLLVFGWEGKDISLKFHVTHARVGYYSMKVLFTHKSIRGSVSLAQRSLFTRSMGTWKNLNLEERILSVQCSLLLVSRVCVGL